MTKREIQLSDYAKEAGECVVAGDIVWRVRAIAPALERKARETVEEAAHEIERLRTVDTAAVLRRHEEQIDKLDARVSQLEVDRDGSYDL